MTPEAVCEYLEAATAFMEGKGDYGPSRLDKLERWENARIRLVAEAYGLTLEQVEAMDIDEFYRLADPIERSLVRRG